MESELILFQLHYSQVRDCRCQCEKPNLRLGAAKLLIYYKPSKRRGGKESSSGTRAILSSLEGQETAFGV